MGSSNKKILNTNNLVPSKTKERMFFGEYSGFQRYDNPTYNFAVIQEEKQRNAFWNPKEISMINDALKFPDLPEFIQEVMIRVWLFQTLMDSAQNSGLEEVLASLYTNPEFEAMAKTQGYFELIHSISYSHILRGIFSDASVIFDRIADYPEIQQRVNKEIELYSKVKALGNVGIFLEAKEKIDEEVKKYIEENNITDSNELKRIQDVLSITLKQLQISSGEISVEDRNKLILELLVGILALEGVKFYVSFLVTYIINNNYNNKIQGATRIIKLINFDEDIHTNMIAGTIQILKKNKIEGFSELIKSEWFETMALNTFKDVLVDELGFAKYLLSFGDIPTLTLPVIEKFMQYYVDERMQSIGLPKIYNQEKTDVVQWFESYKNLNLDNTAGQESDAAVYSIGILVNDIKDGVMSLYKRAKVFKK